MGKISARSLANQSDNSVFQSDSDERRVQEAQNTSSRCYASAGICSKPLCVCVCVCVSHAGCVKTAKLMRLLFGTEAVLC